MLARSVVKFGAVKRRAFDEFLEKLLSLQSFFYLSGLRVNQETESVILMYHGVVPRDATRFNWRHLSTSDFEVQLRYLKRRCNVVSVGDLFAGKGDSGVLNVAITFDDGFKNNLDHAAPLLEKYRLPASFYVTGAADAEFEWLWPDFLDVVSRYVQGVVDIDGKKYCSTGKNIVSVDTGQLLSDVVRNEQPEYCFKENIYDVFRRWAANMYRTDITPYWQLLNNAEIQSLAAHELFTIGSHGYYHNNLGSLNSSMALDELRKSKSYLENLLNCSVDELAYPDGSYSPELIEKAKEIGYTIQHGVYRRFNELENCASPLFREGLYSYAKPIAQIHAALRSTAVNGS